MKICVLAVLATLLLSSPAPASAQRRPDPAAAIAAQQEAMAALSVMDGRWRGEAWSLLPSGERHALTQTERVGPFLDGAVKVVEGRGYEADGTVSFNALAVISYDPERRVYSMRSYTRGQAGDFVLVPTENGFMWEIPAGPATIRYTAVIQDGIWHETGEYIMPDQPSRQIFEMRLKRLGDTEWPMGDVVPLR